jgi:transposase-like protein
MSQPILGLTRSKKAKQFRFSVSEKKSIIEDYLQSHSTKQEIWEKYTGYQVEHGQILRWMRKFGYVEDVNEKSSTFVVSNRPMKPKTTPKNDVPDFENLQLQNRIFELEKKLKDSELKGIAYQTMIDIAEREFNISIKKNFGFKPSKK